MGWFLVNPKSISGTTIVIPDDSDGILFTEEVQIQDVIIKGGKTQLCFRRPFKAKNITLDKFGSDGILVQTSNFELINITGNLPTNLVPYHERHPDFIQFTCIVSPENPRVDPTGKISDGVIRGARLYAPTISNKNYRGCQGITSFEGSIHNVIIEDFDIQTDVDQHGITILEPHNCTLKNGRISSVSGNNRTGVVMSNRKFNKQGKGNKIINVVAEYADIEAETTGSVKKMLRDRILEAIKQSGVNSIPMRTMIVTESGVVMRGGMPSLLYERHVFKRNLIKLGYDVDELLRNRPELDDIIGYTNYSKYGSYKKQRERFALAYSVDKEAACRACSWGFAQILGENYEEAGFISAEHMFEECHSEEGQTKALINFIKSVKGLKEALNSLDVHKSKVLYNGAKLVDLDNNGLDDWEERFSKNLAREIMRSNGTKKLKNSKTVKREVKVAASKIGTGVIASTPLIANQSSQEGLIKVIDSFKEAVISSSDSVSQATNKISNTIASNSEELEKTKEMLESLMLQSTVMGWAILVILIFVLFGLWNLWGAYRQYIDDRGYIPFKMPKQGMLDHIKKNITTGS